MERRVFGPPGTGKTTFLTHEIGRAASQFGPDAVFVSSFTRAAAAELVGRDLPILQENIGTLHSHCYRLLGGPQIADTPEGLAAWTSEHPTMPLSHKVIDRDSYEEDGVKGCEADELFTRYRLNRLRMVPRDTWSADVASFATDWEEWKRSTGTMDFADLIEVVYHDWEKFPGRINVGFIDEAQDLCPLALALTRKWGSHMDYFYVAGDDDQCQPPGETVLTDEGYKPIESLDPKSDRLCSYDKTHSYVMRGKQFSIAERDFSGYLRVVSCDQKKIRTTPNHKWLVKFDKSKPYNVVYIMRKGGDYRVGWCQAMRSDGCVHWSVRARLEGADALWVLDCFEDRVDASLLESWVAAKFGITTAPFIPHGPEMILYTQESLNRLFRMIRSSCYVEARVRACLAYFHRDINYPMWTPYETSKRRWGSSVLTVESCNLIPGLMKLPVHGGKKLVTWTPIDRIEFEKYSGPVYSLNVEPHHTYITHGIVTHNCIYAFQGATPDAFLDPPLPSEQKLVLKQSHRVPQKVHRYAEWWIRRVKVRETKEYRPREERGELRFEDASDGGLRYTAPEKLIKDASRYMDAGKRVMVLARAGYMLDPLVRYCRKEGIPFHNPYARDRYEWNPLTPTRGVSAADRLKAYLKPCWLPEDAERWLKVVRRRGTKLRPHVDDIVKSAKVLRPDSPLYPSDLTDDPDLELMWVWGTQEEKLAWFRDNLSSSGRGGIELNLACIEKGHKVGETPLLIPGTFHSVKGGEAEVVYLMPDMPPAVKREWDIVKDSEYRTWYVGITRARESLVLCGNGNANSPYLLWGKERDR